MASRRLQLIIADDHTLVAQALSRVLEDDFELIEVVADGEALVEAVKRSRPDLVVTDIRMPKLGGLEAIRAIRSLPDPPAIVVLSMYAQAALAEEALEAGASGFVLKQAAATELVEALLAAHAGLRFVTPALRDSTRRASPGTASAKRGQPTPRQREVLELIARGYRMKEIARELRISRRTVESHKYQMMATLGARSTAELIQHALRLGVIGPSIEPPSRRDRSEAPPLSPDLPGVG
jgi:DNA-binding NarL/FixJ family response regulator